MRMDTNTWTYINIAILVLLLIWAAFEAVQFFRRKNAGVDLDPEAFKENMRRAQIIDLREKSDFDAAHILGARNIPFLEFKQRMGEIRKDQPVYLYDQRKTFSRRASLLLQKEGYPEIFRLKEGYESWDGKIKKRK